MAREHQHPHGETHHEDLLKCLPMPVQKTSATNEVRLCAARVRAWPAACNRDARGRGD
jgi:hypothetical protein